MAGTEKSGNARATKVDEAINFGMKESAAEIVACMEEVLEIYVKRYAPRNPVVTMIELHEQPKHCWPPYRRN